MSIRVGEVVLWGFPFKGALPTTLRFMYNIQEQSKSTLETLFGLSRKLIAKSSKQICLIRWSTEGPDHCTVNSPSKSRKWLSPMQGPWHYKTQSRLHHGKTLPKRRQLALCAGLRCFSETEYQPFQQCLDVGGCAGHCGTYTSIPSL